MVKQSRNCVSITDRHWFVIFMRKWENLKLKNDRIFVFFSRKVVLLQKKEEEAFGFEIQVRLMEGISFPDLLIAVNR